MDDYGPRDLVGYGETTPDPKWPGGAKIAISIVLNYEEGSETTPVNGDSESCAICSELGPGAEPFKGKRNVNIESLYEYGSRAGVWRILRLFKEYGVKCTSWAVGQALEMNPEVAKAMIRDGHEVASLWTEEEEHENVLKTIKVIKDLTGQAPRGWYYGNVQCEAGERSRALTVKAYKDAGEELKYWSDDYSDDLPHWIPRPGTSGDKGLLVVPYALDTNDYKDGAHNSFLSPDNFASYLIGAFDELYREGQAGTPKMLSIGLHCRLVGRPGRLAGLRKFFEHVAKHDGVWYAKREEVADHWIKTHPYQAK